LIFHNDAFSEFEGWRESEREFKPACGENRRRVKRQVNQANPYQNGESSPELIPMVSCFAQTASTGADTGSDLNCL